MGDRVEWEKVNFTKGPNINLKLSKVVNATHLLGITVGYIPLEAVSCSFKCSVKNEWCVNALTNS